MATGRKLSDGAECVLFIGGWGRSGSTLLEALLAELPQVVVLGEVVHLWERGLRRNELCACELTFHECPFWSEIGHRAFGGWSAVDPDHVARLKETVDRHRRLPRTLRRRPSRATTAAVLEYADHYRRVYRAAREISGAQVVVDSSKETPTAVTLSHHPEIDLRLLHIVRDSRGVAYSWSKTVARPESPTGEPMQRYSPATSTVFWLAGNITLQAMAYRNTPLTRLRYEDMVTTPLASIGRAWNALDLPGTPNLPMLGERTIELHRTHSVAGNPMRFRSGITTLVPDIAWQSDLSVWDRRLVTAMSYPLLRRWGYLTNSTSATNRPCTSGH